MGKFTPAPPTANEETDVATLVAVSDGGLTVDAALSLLRRHDGDVEKAGAAMLESDAMTRSVPMDVSQEAGTSAPMPTTSPTSKAEEKPPVIDLTAEDEDKELSRALRASLEDQGPKFGPSNRAPNDSWAMVPSNVAISTVSVPHDDQSLSRAIEASLTANVEEEMFVELPLEERVRKDGRPIALRPTLPSLNYAALILQGLFFVPQVRQAVARWRPLPDTPEEGDNVKAFSHPGSDAAATTWSLMEIFANMDLALMGELSVDAVLEALSAEQWSSPLERPGDVSFIFYCSLAWHIELVLHDDVPTNSAPSWPRLFHFRHGFSDDDLSNTPFDRRIDPSAVKVTVGGSEESNDLMSCLAIELGLSGDDTKQQVIFEPSEVVAFQILRDIDPPSYEASLGAGPRPERTTFVYPKHVYLDQFMKNNYPIAIEKRRKQRELLAEVEQLLAKRASLTRHNNRDTLADLRSSLHYYEHVAEDDDSAERKAMIHDTALKLRKILARIENELQTIDATVARLKLEAANIFDCPELRQHRYDLRVVLVHDGLYGRNHLYSYVKHKNAWWKTVDYAVTEVSEDTVLNDSIGLHLGTGPYFLIYSLALSAEVENTLAPWPEAVKNSVKHNNRLFLSELPSDVAEQVLDPNSPPSSPTPSEFTMSSSIVEPPQSREEPMDLVEDEQ
ncbi:uncharacterized protein LAESUDRAFT_811244 [Laetiporus sulphureus 93-53]|uniref:Peptidase C19 ubiquitin carboxyl-terminal hydrolase domain-containing protein n=1 Tax=Laetiporus sulphureus 93-53 TaxID=1314785 RepID=A0A165F9E9_9APHY|nr:uncharacterized protein LAESUDRAFT_811244 [Laetiporus sulphureus 93-53]KZT08631.1 hypothetical protein LAESUDRAFT_811244 [Laetiporus sulphureus 93-53]